jgi:uncharacterized protein YodC (DUF2158 family)
MADDFKAGDVVQLKSGGPEMTINYIQDTVDGKQAVCIWFEGKKQSVGYFGFHVLKHVEQANTDNDVPEGMSALAREVKKRQAERATKKQGE